MKNKRMTPRQILYVAAGSLALLCLGLSYGWSVFRGHFGAMHSSWSDAMLSGVFSISMICFGLGSMLSSRLAKRMSAVRVLCVGALMLMGGFMGVSALPALDPAGRYAGLCVLYGGMGGLSTGLCYNAINSSIPRYFPQIKGTISGVMMVGYGCGSLVLGTIASALIRHPRFGLFRTFAVLGVMIALCLMLCALAMRRLEQEHCGQERQQVQHTSAQSGYSPREVIAMPAFWMLFLRNVCSYAACLIVIENAAGIAGMIGLSGTFGLLISVFNGAARLPSGMLCDRIGAENTLKADGLVGVLAAVCLVIARRMELGGLMIAAFLLIGVAYGMIPPVSVVVNEEFFGGKYRAANYALFSFMLAPASLLGPGLTGLLMSPQLLGETAGFVMMTIYSAAACALSFMLRRPVGAEQKGSKDE